MPKERQQQYTNFDFASFGGFDSPTTTPTPDLLFDFIMQELNEAELKVVLYIIRRTYGFKKGTDDISLSQLVDGIITKDGRILDRGTGLSKSAVKRALQSLRSKNVIHATLNQDPQKGNLPTTYSLKMRNTPRPVSGPRVGPVADQGLAHQWTPQETVLQETVEQDISKYRKGSLSAENVDNSEAHSDGEATSASTFRPVPPRIREKGNGEFTPVGDTVARKTFRRSGPEYNEARQVILEYISDFALEMGDEAKLSASVTRAVNLYRRSGRELGEFTSALYEARSRTKEYTGNVKKRKASPDGQYAGKNKMPYFFSVLEELLGLKEDDAENGSVASPRPGTLGMGGQRPRKPHDGHDTSLP